MKAIHTNSTESLSAHKASGRQSHYRQAILNIVKNATLTDRQLMHALNETDFNNIRPEVTRLKQAGLIREVGKVTCQWTGKKVRTTTAIQN